MYLDEYDDEYNVLAALNNSVNKLFITKSYTVRWFTNI